MFGKKKKEIQPKPVLTYQNWSEDLGFLFLILEREKKLVKTFNLNVLGDQLDSTDYLDGKFVNPYIEAAVNSVLDKLSDNYVNFLVEKFFKSKKALIIFLTEDIYFDFTSAAINSNNAKIQSKVQAERLEALRKRNGATE